MDLAIGRFSSFHPVVRIVSFFLFSLFLALGSASQLVTAAILLLVLYLMAGVGSLANAVSMLRRMRWFFLSIIIIYAWLTPGRPLWGEGLPISWWVPTVEGMLMGGHRLLALVMMVLGVQWLLWVTSRAQLVSALYWLSTPLRVIGFSRNRLVVRVALTLEVLEQIQGYLGEQLKKATVKRGDLRGYAAVAATLVSDVAQRSEHVSCQTMVIDIEPPPPLAQWLWPLALTVLMLLVA